MKNIFFFTILLLFFGCSCKQPIMPKKIKKEAYLVKIINKNIDLKPKKAYLGAHFYTIDAEYAGHLILDENNQIYFYGPDKELEKKIKNLKENPPNTLYRVRPSSDDEKKDLFKKHPNLSCSEESNICSYEAPAKLGSEDFAYEIWMRYSSKVPIFKEDGNPRSLAYDKNYVYVEPEYGKEFAKKNKSKIDCKYYKIMFGDRLEDGKIFTNSWPFQEVIYMFQNCK